MRRKIALALVMLLVFLPVTALAGNIAEKDDYSDDQINPSRLSQSAPFTLTGTLSNGSFGGDVDCVTFTADERARYVFELSSDTKVFIPTVGLIKLSGSNDYDTLTKYSANTPADTASVYFDFKKGDTVIVVMTMASLEVPEGKNPYTLNVTKADIPSNITGFSLPGIELKDVVIDSETSTVTAVAPAGSDLTNIAPSIEGSLGDEAVFIPAIDVPQDFSKPVKYKLSAETGSTEEWTIIIRTEGQQENIADLKSVLVDGNALKDFSPDVTQYDITVPFDKEEIGFAVKALSDLATLSDRFVSKPLEVGANTVDITVTAESGEQKTYTFNILREPKAIEDVSSTKSDDTKTAEPLPSYVVIGIVVLGLAAVGLTLYLLRNKLFFHR